MAEVFQFDSTLVVTIKHFFFLPWLLSNLSQCFANNTGLLLIVVITVKRIVAQRAEGAEAVAVFPRPMQFVQKQLTKSQLLL